MGHTAAVSVLAAGLVLAWGRAGAEPADHGDAGDQHGADFDGGEPGDGEPRLITGAPVPPDPDPGLDDPAPPATGPRRDHKGQFGLSAQFVTGSRFIKTYDDEFCGDRAGPGTGSPNATLCFTRVPVSLDLAASYGITRKIELFLEVRLGLERDFGSSINSGAGPRLHHYAPGVKFYFNEKGIVKFFSTVQIALDTTNYKDATGESLGADMLIRNANGVHIDFHDAYGAYVFFGEQIAFVRWLEGGLEFGVGIQGRYP